MQFGCYTPVTLERDYTEFARQCEISQSSVAYLSPKKQQIILFAIFVALLRCYGVPAAIVAFLRSFHGVRGGGGVS